MKDQNEADKGQDETDFPGSSMVKSPPAMQETQRLEFDSWVRKVPGTGDMTTHSSILAWKVSRTVEPGGLQSTGVMMSQTQMSKESGMNE